ncbi:reverse transcriptase domain-containing protein, partial [Tanacetum coccineum]
FLEGCSYMLWHSYDLDVILLEILNLSVLACSHYRNVSKQTTRNEACKPRDFNGKGGAIALTRWIEKMESARGHKAVLGMTWEEFKALLVEEFCPSNEMEKLENEFWNHAMVRANHTAYTDRFHELAKLVPHLVTP